MTVADRATTDDLSPSAFRWGLLTLLLVGFAVRLIAARGGLWIDEAWSVIFADEAAPFLGVFASIHHDNNHHLNTLWLQLTGAAAPSPILRGLSIASGTAAIWVAAHIGLLRSRATGMATALLFALSPMLILYGSEARGYAPMLLCLLGVILFTFRWSEAPDAAFPSTAVARLSLLGTLAHLMMAPGLAIVGLWTASVAWRRHGLRGAFTTTLQAWLPAFIMSALVLFLILGSAHFIAGGMGVGSFTPFSAYYFDLAMGELATLTTAVGNFGDTRPLGLVIILLLCIFRPRDIPPLFLFLVLALPLAVLLFQPGNSQFSRYYLISATGLMLLAGNRIGAMADHRGVWRVLAICLLGAFTLLSVHQFRQHVAVGRGHPDRPVAMLVKALPRGARVLINHERAQAVLRVAARQAGYRLVLNIGDCARQADALYIERERGVPVAPHMVRCDKNWRAIGHADAIGPSGQSWTLYLPERRQ
jgi:hypothetical protein